MSKDLVTIHCYVDQLVDNTDGRFDRFSSAWFIVPKEWAGKMAVKYGFHDLEDFYNTYTYDNTDGWMQRAVDDGVLEGCGAGYVGPTNEVQEAPFEYTDRTNGAILRRVLMARPSLEELCELLDSCHDLHSLGYIGTQREQDILDFMSEQSALTLWAIHRYVHKNDVNMEYTFSNFVIALRDIKKEEGKNA